MRRSKSLKFGNLIKIQTIASNVFISSYLLSIYRNHYSINNSTSTNPVLVSILTHYNQ